MRTWAEILRELPGKRIVSATYETSYEGLFTLELEDGKKLKFSADGDDGRAHLTVAMEP